MTEEHTIEDQDRSRSIWTVIIFTLILGFLAFLALGLNRSQEGPVRVGSEAPQFTLTTYDGETYNTADYAGQVIVVNFWASWCKPCEEEAGELQQAWEMYRDQGVLFVGVAYSDTPSEAQAYLERFNVTYPSGPDLQTRISEAYRMRGVPETYIIGPDGTITAVMIGPYQSLDEIIADIELALQEQ
jgi:cytochrome c biogenesis protein CcmG/thiol:disulfide interchange protein DsbE